MALTPDEIRNQMIETSTIVENTLKSIAAQIGDIFQDALSEADSISKVFGKDLEKQLKSLARSTDKMIENQAKINKGMASSKDIAKQLLDYTAKREILEKRIKNLMQEQPQLAAQLQQQLIDVDAANQDYIDSLEQQKEYLEGIENKVGLLGKLIKASNKIPLIGNLIDTNDIMADLNVAAASTNSKLGLMAKGLGGIGKGIAKGLMDPISLILFFTTQAFKANSQAVDLGKQLGYNANNYRESLTNIELSTGNINVTTENLTKAFQQISDATGLAYKYTADQLTTQIKLTEQVGLQADEATNIYKTAVTTGQTSEAAYKSYVRGLVTARNQLRVGINFKAALAEAAKVSGELALNLGYNPERIGKAVVQMKALGTSLEQAKSQGESLLNFESSIENELKAELLTGRQMNLERARAAALSGDMVTVAQELANQGMTLQKFEKLNVLARQSYAAAIGLSVDEMAKQLQNQELALESGKSLAQVTQEEAMAAIERQKAQEKFAKGMEKLTSIIGNLFAGPLGVVLDVIADTIAGIAWVFEKLTKLFGSPAMKLITGTLAGVGIGLATGGIGWIPAALGAAGGLGLSGASAAMGDDIVSPGYGQRMIFHPEGAVALNNNDTIVAGTNLGGSQSETINTNIDLSPMIAAINAVKASVDKLNSKETHIYLDGKQVGTTLYQGSYKVV